MRSSPGVSVGSQGVPDPEVLAFATCQIGFLSLPISGQCPAISAPSLKRMASVRASFSSSRGRHWPDVIEALVLVWAASGADEWKNRIVQIPEP